jgi:plastocyanin
MHIKRLCIMVNFGQAAVGIVLLVVVAGGLLYIFFSRTNAVEKTGYGSLIMLAIVALMIPVLWISEGGNQVSAQKQQFSLAVDRGMQDYAQYCTDQCYAIVKNKVTNATYNGYTMDYFKGVSDDEVRRIVAGGVYNPSATHQPANASAVPKSDQYGGALLSSDVDYLFALIRSTDSKYLQTNGYSDTANGLDSLIAYLQANNPTAYDNAVSFGQYGQFGQPVDMSRQKTITIDIVNPGQEGTSCQSKSGCFAPINIKVKVGTVITWVNKSNLGHTVTAIAGQNTSSPKAAQNIFDSGQGSSSKLIDTGASFKYTVTNAAYTADAAGHSVLYYCRIHPDMLAELTIVP